MIKTRIAFILMLLSIATSVIAQERVKFLCKGAKPNPEHRYLNGTTTSGVVNLAPNTSSLYSGTIWEKVSVGGDVFIFRCLNNNNSNPKAKFFYLNGVTSTGQVNLASDKDAPNSGTHWKEVHLKDGTLAFQCLNSSLNPKGVFLNGNTATGGVNLAGDNNEKNNSGTHWAIER